MQLNRQSFNSSSLNGSPRSAIRGEGAAALAVAASAVALRTVNGVGATAVTLHSEIALSSIRIPHGTVALTSIPDFVPSVLRGAAGTVRMAVRTSLFYTRTKTLEGAFLVDVVTRGDVGVVFISGQSVIHPLTLEVDPTRARCGKGSAPVQTGITGSASATRRARATCLVPLRAALDPAWRKDGVRYIMAGMLAPVGVKIEDDGIAIGVNLPPAPVTIRGTGSASAVRTAGGTGRAALQMEGDWTVVRHASGRYQTTVRAHLDGDSVVRATATATVRTVMPSMTGYVTKRSLQGTVDLTVGTQVAAIRRSRLAGSLNLPLVVDGSGERLVIPDARVPLVTVFECDGSALRVGDGETDNLTRFEASLSGEVHVRDTVTMTLGPSFELEASRVRVSDLHHNDIEAVVELDGHRLRLGSGAVVVSLPPVSLMGTSRRTGAGAVRTALAVGVDLLRYAGFDGEALVGVDLPSMEGLRTIMADAEAAIPTLSAGEDFHLARIGEGEVSVSVVAAMEPLRAVTLEGTAIIDALTSSSAFLNPASDDIASQHFARPAEQRLFERAETQRVFERDT